MQATTWERRGLAILLCASLAGGCASTGGGRVVAPVAQAHGADGSVLAEYVQRLPPGAAVRVRHTSGRSVRGTLMKATAQSLILQPRTRIPEAPVEIALTDVLSVTPESNGGSVGKAIGIGVAAGAGAALAVFLIIAAIYAD